MAVPVDVEDINLSLVQKFPYASLRFSKVVVPEVNVDSPDTLLFVEDLYLQIGLLDFFSGDYFVSEAEFNGGFFRMKTLEDDSKNYVFWKTSTDSSESQVNLSNIELKDFTYQLTHRNDLSLSVTIEKADINGDFSAEEVELNSDLDLTLLSLVVDQKELYTNTEISGGILFAFGSENEVYTFQSNQIEIENESFSLNGLYSNEEISFWKASLIGDKVNAEKCMNLIPLESRESLKNYEVEGKTGLNIDLGSKNGFSVLVDIDNFRGKLNRTGTSAELILNGYSGSYALNDSKSNLDIKRLDGQIGPGKFSVKGAIHSFTRPRFDLDLQGKLELDELKDFLNIQFAEKMEGEVNFDGVLSGDIRSNKVDNVTLLKGINFKGDIELKNGILKIRDHNQSFTDVEGLLEIAENAVVANRLSGKLGSNSFVLEGKIDNALPFLTGEGESIYVTADLKMPVLKLEEVLSSSSDAESPPSLSFPEKVGFKLGVEIGEITYKSFKSSQITGIATYSNGLFSLNPVSMGFGEGSIRGKLKLREIEGGFEVASTALIQSVEVDKLFEGFDNFGQQVVTSKNLDGQINADITFGCVMDSFLNINKESIGSNVNLTIVDGKLQNVQSLVEVADYIRSEPLWNTFIKTEELKSKLKNIEFDTFRNNLTIENQNVTIPEMEISSSILTLTASGVHGFDNSIDYSMSFRLSELLQTGREKESEFGYIVDDGTGFKIFIRASGSLENPVFSKDKASARQSRKEKFEEEKRNFKGILKEEFGLFKSDTTATLPQNQVDEPEPFIMEVEFGPGDTLPDSTQTKKKKGKRKKDDYEGLEDDDDL